jgi:hypothetical protein
MEPFRPGERVQILDDARAQWRDAVIVRRTAVDSYKVFGGTGADFFTGTFDSAHTRPRPKMRPTIKP